MAKQRIFKVWVGINKNGFVTLHNEQPFRDIKQGKWMSKKPICNYIIQRQIEDMVKQSQMNWESDTEFFQFSYEEDK